MKAATLTPKAVPALPLSVLLLAAALGTASSGNAEVNECRNGEMTRTVEVVYTTPGQPVPCEVLYAKNSEGTLETLWRANNEAGYCESKAAEFVSKLEDQGWVCSPKNPPPSDEPTSD